MIKLFILCSSMQPCVWFFLFFFFLLFLINHVCENFFFIFRNSWFFRGTRPLVGLGRDKESLTLTRIDREVARRILWVGIDRLIWAMWCYFSRVWRGYKTSLWFVVENWKVFWGNFFYLLMKIGNFCWWKDGAQMGSLMRRRRMEREIKK